MCSRGWILDAWTDPCLSRGCSANFGWRVSGLSPFSLLQFPPSRRCCRRCCCRRHDFVWPSAHLPTELRELQNSFSLWTDPRSIQSNGRKFCDANQAKATTSRRGSWHQPQPKQQQHSWRHHLSSSSSAVSSPSLCLVVAHNPQDTHNIHNTHQTETTTYTILYAHHVVDRFEW